MEIQVSRSEINALWDRLDQEAVEAKCSHQALSEFSKEYGRWSAESQRIARKEFGRWLQSKNARKRFDALSLIEEFGAIEARGDLQNFKERLESQSGPEASYELDRVNAILTKL